MLWPKSKLIGSRQHSGISGIGGSYGPIVGFGSSTTEEESSKKKIALANNRCSKGYMRTSLRRGQSSLGGYVLVGYVTHDDPQGCIREI